MENIYFASLIAFIIALLFGGISYVIVYALVKLYESTQDPFKKIIVRIISIVLILSFLYCLPILISYL